MLKSVLIFGASGCLGRELDGAIWPQDWEVTCADRSCDITDASKVEGLVEALKPSIVINAAAYINVDGAEAERDKAFAVNAIGPRHIASACRQRGSKMIQISSDMIFGGKRELCPPSGWAEFEKPEPVNAYGASKLEGEAAVSQHLGGSMTDQFCIVRTSWLLGSRNWLPWAINLPAGLMASSQRSCRPTLACDLAVAVVKIADALRAGIAVPEILHFANHGVIERGRLLQTINPGLKVNPDPAPERGAKRAQRSILNCGAYERWSGDLIPHWAGRIHQAIASAKEASEAL